MTKEFKKPKTEMQVEAKPEPVKPKKAFGKVANCEKLNIRKSPSLESDILEVAFKNDKLSVNLDNSVSGWYAVTTASGCSGYTMVQYVETK